MGVGEYIDPTTEGDERLYEEISGHVYDTAADRRIIETTRDIIRPLIERADVSDELKAAALSPGTVGVHPDELEYDRGDITAAMAGMIQGDLVTLTAAGAYELTDKPRDPDTEEAVKSATKILAGWPEPEVNKILSVLRG